MSKKTSLKQLLGKPALMTFKEDNFWPIPDQFMGVEIELENYDNVELHTHMAAGEPFWAQHRDGSLRGRSVELVLNQPMMGNSLKEAIHYFFRTFKTITPSPRTSIHVHINMLQDEESLEGLKNTVVLYYMFENAFFAIADDGRKWNGYCNPFDDAPPDILQAFMQFDDLTTLGKRLHQSAGVNGNRYYGLNINALQRYGTLEFRHLPLVTSEERLLDWMRLIMELKAAGGRMADEGVSPSQVFLQPDDLIKLMDYMPAFGKTLLGLVDQGTAFVRMANIAALRVRPSGIGSGTVEGNKAFARFLETQQKAGRKVVEDDAPVAEEPVRDALEEDAPQEVFQRGIERLINNVRPGRGRAAAPPRPDPADRLQFREGVAPPLPDFVAREREARRAAERAGRAANGQWRVAGDIFRNPFDIAPAAADRPMDEVRRMQEEWDARVRMMNEVAVAPPQEEEAQNPARQDW